MQRKMEKKAFDVALEALPPARMVRQVRRQHSDGHGTIQPRVSPAIYLVHSLRCERGKDFVGAQS